MAEQITFPADNSTFTIGNTTYVWDDPPGIWRAYTVGDFSGGGSGGDPNWIPSFAANNQVVSAGNSFSGTLFTAPADGNGTWGILSTGRNSTSNNALITTTDSNTWGYIANDGTIEYLPQVPGSGTLISQGSFSGGAAVQNAWVYLAPGDSLTFGFRFDGPSYRYIELEPYSGSSTTVNIGGAGSQVYFGNTPTTEPAESMGSLFYRYDTTDPANDTNTTIYNRFYINVGNNTWREFASGNPNSELRFAPTGLDAIVEPNWASPTEQITTTGTWTVPTTLTDTQWVFFYLIGGGGGTAQSDGGRATGGGAGASLFAVPAASLTEASYAVTIGAGGSGAERGSGLATASAGGTTILDFDASSLYGSGLTILSAGGGGGANADGSTRNAGIGGFGNFQWYDADHAHTTTGAAGQGLTRAAADYATGTGLRGGTGGTPTGSGSTVFGGAATGVTTVFAGTFGQGGPNSNNRNGLAGVFRVYY